MNKFISVWLPVIIYYIIGITEIIIVIHIYNLSIIFNIVASFTYGILLGFFFVEKEKKYNENITNC